MDQLREWLYDMVAFIARVHDALWACNRGLLSTPFTDKQLHFIVIGGFGLLLFLLVLPLFIFLTRRNRPGLIAWLFAFMTVLFVTFAIEIGQQVTDTGKLELEDIVYGIVGFFAVSVIVGMVYLLVLLIRMLFQK